MKKKAKGKSKGTAKKAAKEKAPATKRTPSKKKGKDIVQVRENINELVKDSAKDIATEVIKVAKTGQLASAKYLFEAAGIYPATEQTTVNPIERSLAHTLLTRMGLPLDPVIVTRSRSRLYWRATRRTSALRPTSRTMLKRIRRKNARESRLRQIARSKSHRSEPSKPLRPSAV
ncbi:MAG: hypothetical protein WAL60_20255 [Candidatus Sulfotelmatobacter sp.]